MPTCASCGCDTSNQDNSDGNPTELCRYHGYQALDGWALANKTMCDGIHRRQWPTERCEVGIEGEQPVPPSTDSTAFWD